MLKLGSYAKADPQHVAKVIAAVRSAGARGFAAEAQIDWLRFVANFGVGDAAALADSVIDEFIPASEAPDVVGVVSGR